jgi:hypothetical protein
MRSERAKAVLLLLGGGLVSSLLALAWVMGAASSEADNDTMYNCPQAGKWAISVWSGQDGTDTGQALDACGVPVDVAYYIDPDTQTWLRYFVGRTEISNLLTLYDKQGIVARGAGPAAPATSAIPGTTYTGTISQDMLIEFEVGADGLTITRVRYSVSGTEPGGGTCNTLTISTVSAPIMDNGFSISNTLFDMSGSFQSQWQASGELTVHEPWADGVLPCNAGPLTWTAAIPSPTPSPAPGPGQLTNCPQPNKWAISVWSGPNDVDTQTALATCPDTPIAAAYWLDPSSQGWLRYFQDRPEISNLPTLDNLQGLIVLGGAAVSTPTPTPSPTPTAIPSPTPTVLSYG